MTSNSVFTSSFSLSERPLSEFGGTRSSCTSTMMRSFFRGSNVIRLCDDNPNAARSLLAPSGQSLHGGVLLVQGEILSNRVLYNDHSYFAERDQSCTGGLRCLQQQFVVPLDEPSG